MGNLKQHRFLLAFKQKLKIACEILKGLIGMHEAGVIHRDIKDENILLDKCFSEEGVEEIKAVIGDFGLSCWAENDPDRQERRGSLLYMPEAVRYKCEPASFASDAWSVGMLFSELFDNIDYDNLITVESELDLYFRNWPKPANEESPAYVILGLLQTPSSQRMTLPEALAILSKLS
jgi:serine/threonine protein kinase